MLACWLAGLALVIAPWEDLGMQRAWQARLTGCIYAPPETTTTTQLPTVCVFLGGGQR